MKQCLPEDINKLPFCQYLYTEAVDNLSLKKHLVREGCGQPFLSAPLLLQCLGLQFQFFRDFVHVTLYL